MWLALGLHLFFSISSHAAATPVTIAVIDTGFDLDHEILSPRLHLGETDEEAVTALAGVQDFQDNSHLKQPALSGQPLQEVLHYRTLKAKSHQQGLSFDERVWMDRRSLDPRFKENLKTFKRHVHGTIVAGIALNQGEGLSVFPVRGLGIEVPTVVVEGEQEKITPILKRSEAEFRRQVQLSANRSIRKMRKMLVYIAHHRIPIVNASYGVTEKHILRRFAELHREITGLALDPLRLKEVVDGFFMNLYERGDKLLQNYPETLFVFSAGNSAQDNDQHHHFPSRLRGNHVISVAALNGEKLASFSNWGQAKVDVAAPGVGISSLVPRVYSDAIGIKEIPASGTSMAAPFVANVAARCLQRNPKLKAAQLKRILAETGMPWKDLQGKLVSERAVDEKRALDAAMHSNEMDLDSAIKLALAPTSSGSSSSPGLVKASPDKSLPPSEVLASPPRAPDFPTASEP